MTICHLVDDDVNRAPGRDAQIQRPASLLCWFHRGNSARGNNQKATCYFEITLAVMEKCPTDSSKVSNM